MKILLHKKVFAVSVLVMIILCLGISFGGDVIVKQGSQYITGKLGIGTVNPLVSLDIRDGEQRILGSNAASGDAIDVLVVIGGQGGSDAAGGKGSDIFMTAGMGGKAISQEPGTGGDVTVTAGKGGNKDFYIGSAAKGGGIKITSGAGGDIPTQFSSMKGGNSGDIELNVGQPGKGQIPNLNGNYGNVVLAKDGGKVGIGTASPSASLDVAGTVKMTGLIIPSGTTPAPDTEGALFLDTDEGINGTLKIYSKGAWRIIKAL